MNQTIGVNITPQSFQPTLHYSQGDVGRVFVINVTDYDIPTGATVTCVATKPSGMGFTVSGTVSGNSVTFTSTAEMTDEWGRFPAEIRIASGNTLLGTANFLMIGEKDPHPASTIDGTQEELIPQLTLLVNRVEAAAESVHDLTVSATTLTAGSDATATYDSTNNSIAFGIPRGADGDVTRSEFNDLKSASNELFKNTFIEYPLVCEQGGFSSSTGADYSATYQIRTKELPIQDMVCIKADDSYRFRPHLFASDGTYLGYYYNGALYNEASADRLTKVLYNAAETLSAFGASKIKISIANPDANNTWVTIYPSEATNLHIYYSNELEGFKDDVFGLSVNGNMQGDLDFGWEFGSINVSTGAVVSGTYYSYSKKIPKKAFEGATFNLTAVAETYAYAGDTFISRRGDIPTTANYQPSSSFLPSHATDVILVIPSLYRLGSSATYSFDALATKDALNALATTVSNVKQNKGLLYQYVDIEKPYFSEKWDGNRISTNRYGVLGGAFIKFDSVTFLGQSGFVTKTWSDFKTDVANDQYVTYMTAYDGTLDTFVLFNGSGIIYNRSTNKFSFKVTVYLSSLTVNDVVMLYVDDNGSSYGAIREIAEAKKKNLYLDYKGEVANRIVDTLKGDKFTFAFATDCHWWFDTTTDYINRTNDVVKDLYDSVRYDAYINGGDSIFYGTKFKQNAVASMEQAFGIPTDNMIYCVGNHDFNGVGITGTTQNVSWMLTDDEYEAIAMRKMQDIHRPSSKRYFYRDFEEKKIRVISLDTSDMDISFDNNGDIVGYDPLVTFAVRQNQLEWLRTTALDCPDSDWGVIVVMHVGLYKDEDGFPDNNTLINSTALINLLSAYVSKSNYSYSNIDSEHGNYFAVSASGSFSTAHGHLIGVWSGHAHADGYCNKDGFNAIQTECGYPDSASRVVGTIDEVCVDCVTVDMDTKTVSLKRIGVGSDRTYTFV